MKTVRAVLAELICSGKVTVEIPGLDMQALKEYLNSEANATLKDITWFIYEEGLSDADRVKYIRQVLEYGPAHLYKIDPP